MLPTALDLDVPRAMAGRSSRATPADHPAKRAARHRPDRDPAPPAPTMPPRGAVQAAPTAAGGGGAGPELPCILFAIVATSAAPALQRHRIAPVVHTPRDRSTPLERPG
jgi:hypothetical protein